METTLYEIEFMDGSKFRVFCANRTQKKKLIADYSRIKHLTKSVTELSNGIHTYPEWVNIVAEKVATKILAVPYNPDSMKLEKRGNRKVRTWDTQ